MQNEDLTGIILGMFEHRLDRSKVQQTSLEQADIDDVQYWMDRTAFERFGGVEQLRRWIYGDAAVGKRIERVISAIELGDN